MGVQWGLAQGPNAFDRYFQQGRQMGQEIAQAQQQRETRNALSAYAVNPSEQSFNALAMAAPEYAMQVQGQRQEQARTMQTQQLRAAAAAGDRDALQQLAAIDPTAYNTFSTQRRQYEQGMVEAASNLAQRILTLPPEQRPQVYAQQIAILGQRFPELAGQEYSDELMQSTIAEAGQWQEFNRSQQPDYMAIPEGGTLVNTRNPQAVQAFQGGGPAPQAPASAPQTQIRVTPREYSALVQRYGPEAVSQRIAAGHAIVTVTTPDEARTLPSGTRILLPDGTEGRVP